MGMVSLTGVAYLLVRIVTLAFPAQFLVASRQVFTGRTVRVQSGDFLCQAAIHCIVPFYCLDPKFDFTPSGNTKSTKSQNCDFVN